jgi:CBS domain-containing protein
LVIQDKKPIGIFTERDVVKSLHRGAHLKKCKIKELMTKPVLSANLEMKIYQAYDLFERNRIRHLAVVNSNGEIVGIVTQTDITNSLGAEYFVEIKEVSKIMTKNVVTVKKGSLVRDAIHKMSELSISCIVVEKINYLLVY